MKACLFADDIVLLAESERMLQRVVDEFYMVCKRRRLKVHFGKSKVMVFERAKNEMISLAKQQQIKTEFMKECKIWLGGREDGGGE